MYKKLIEEGSMQNFDFTLKTFFQMYSQLPFQGKDLYPQSGC